MKGEDSGRVGKKNAASINATHKNTNITASGVRTAGATVIENKIVMKAGLIMDLVDTRKPLGIQAEVSESKAKNGEVMNVSNKRVVL